MAKKFTYIFFSIFFVCTTTLQAQSVLHTDVLIIGGGVSGSAAGIQAARMGVKVIVTEETSWLGGMMTAAGVSAFDGNHNLPSGLWSEFRNELYKVYGGPGKVSTGWVSNTLFEPHVGDSILKAKASLLPNLNILFNHRFESVIKKGNRIIGAKVYDEKNSRFINIMSKQVIDATELGDVMASAGAGYDLGMEASDQTGEDINIPESNNVIQDLTYVAILKDFGSKADCTIVKPSGYSPQEFNASCTDYFFNKDRKAPTVDALKMLNYGKLPNSKYMLNWPIYGNDIYLNVVELDHKRRMQELDKAKQMTLRFVYFIQHELGFKNLGLADDEFPTSDRLALIPYHREGRRLKGLVRFTIKHISNPYEKPLYKTGIAVGDYPIDHHHKKNPAAPQHLDFYPVPSFTIPLGALIPKELNGLIVAEKGISVSNVVNGTTRLQPCVMQIGQAAGALAALAVRQKKEASGVSIRAVQTELLNNGAYIMPFVDVKIGHPHFQAIQKIAATGMLRGIGKPSGWANQTFFYPDSLVETSLLKKDLEEFGIMYKDSGSRYLTGEDGLNLIELLKKRFKTPIVPNASTSIAKNWQEWGFGKWEKSVPLTKLTFAVLLNEYIDPFNMIEVNHQGNFESKY